MQILYKAKDGKIFDSEWECEKYENALECQELKDSLFWWNSEREPIPVSKDVDELFFFRIESEDALEYMEEIFRSKYWSAYDELKVGGMYYWNQLEESFYGVTEQTNRLNNEISELREIRYLIGKGAE